MSALYPCPLCQQLVATRKAPSGAVRLVRHDRKDSAPRPGVPGESCLGTGWEVIAA